MRKYLSNAGLEDSNLIRLVGIRSGRVPVKSVDTLTLVLHHEWVLKAQWLHACDCGSHFCARIQFSWMSHWNCAAHHEQENQIMAAMDCWAANVLYQASKQEKIFLQNYSNLYPWFQNYETFVESFRCSSLRPRGAPVHPAASIPVELQPHMMEQ